jgi:hypothetical protein
VFAPNLEEITNGSCGYKNPSYQKLRQNILIATRNNAACAFDAKTTDVINAIILIA